MPFFGVFLQGFLLWILIILLYRDRDVFWRTCVIWAAIAIIAGWGVEHAAAKLILPSDLQADPDQPFVWTISSTDAAIIHISGLIGSLAVIYSILWYNYGEVRFRQAAIILLVLGGTRLFFIYFLLTGPENYQMMGPP